MLIFRKKFLLFLRDIISFIIYLFIFLKKRSGKITLVYHSVGDINPEDDPHRINISPDNFEKHLKIITRYRDKVDITFDDGYSNNFKHAFPLLKKYDLVATFFLITDFIDRKITSDNSDWKSFKNPPLTWDEIIIMDRSGMKFGSHSKTHPVLTKIPEHTLRKELIDSKRRIEDVVEHQIDSFAYPFGNLSSFNNLTKKFIIESEYHCAYINLMGCNDKMRDRFALKRIRIYTEDGPFKLKMKIKGAYDWIDFIGLKQRMVVSPNYC